MFKKWLVLPNLIAFLALFVFVSPAMADGPTATIETINGEPYLVLEWSFDAGVSDWYHPYSADYLNHTTAQGHTAAGALEVWTTGTDWADAALDGGPNQVLQNAGIADSVVNWNNITFSAWIKMESADSSWYYDGRQARIRAVNTGEVINAHVAAPALSWTYLEATTPASGTNTWNLFLTGYYKDTYYKTWFDDVRLEIPCANLQYNCANMTTPTPTPTATATPNTTPTPTATPQPQTCDLVDNANFTTDDTWLLQGATIQSGTLTLAPGDIAAQNLGGLQDFTQYNAVIEVEQVSGGQVGLDVVLGSDSSTLLIDEAGTYNATFTTPDLGGPLAFGVENTNGGSGTLTITFICLSLNTSNGQHACLAPNNGEFTTASGWDFYRGGSWSSISENVLLPASDQGLLVDPASYVLPALAQDEYLIMAYDARMVNDGRGQIASAATAGSSDATNYFEVFQQTYTFESDLSQLADQTLTQLAFANAADDAFTADLVLDNICIFVSNTPPQLPYPTDPGQITNPVTVGNGISSCDDVDGIWASFGVNMAQYRASYAAGASIWEPGGWVPWLVAAVFVTLSDWSCMFMAAYLSILQTIAHLINNVLNIWQWLETTGIAFFAWLGEWGMWAWLSGANIVGEIGSTSTDWIEWINDLFTSFPLWLILFPNAIGTWIGYHLLLVFYEFVGGWNAVMGLLAAIYGLMIDQETGQLNPDTFAILDQFIPGGSFVGLILWLATEVVYLFIDLVWTAGEMVYFFLAWLWENVITMGHIPINFYYAFNEGTESSSFGSLVSCTTNDNGFFWCTFLAGVELVNRTISHTILYPIVIVGIVVTTLAILWRNLDDLFSAYTS